MRLRPEVWVCFGFFCFFFFIENVHLKNTKECTLYSDNTEKEKEKELGEREILLPSTGMGEHSRSIWSTTHSESREGEDVPYAGYGAGKVLAMEEKKAGQGKSSHTTSRKSHKTGIYRHLAIGAGCMQEGIPEANRYLRLRACSETWLRVTLGY